MAFPPPTQPTDATDSTQTPGWLAPRLNALGQAINDFLSARGAANGLAGLGGDGHVIPAQLPLGVADGIATLGGDGRVTAAQTRLTSGVVSNVTATPVAVSTSAVTASSRILLTAQTTATSPGFPVVTSRTPGASFSIKAVSVGYESDPIDVVWVIAEP